MSLGELDGILETHSAFKSQVEDLALAEVQRLEREEATLGEMLQGVRSELKAARGVLGAVQPPEAKPKPKPKGLTTNTVKNLSAHRRNELMAWLHGKEEEFTAGDVAGSFEWSESQAATAMVIFRHEGHIRLARMGGKTGSQKFYRSLV